MDRKGEQRKYSVLEGIDGDGTVLIGKGTRIVGEISNCTRVEVQGEIEGNLIADKLMIRESGVIAGNIQASEIEVHGSISGDVHVEGLLDVHSTGRVDGNLAYGQIAVAAGGEVSGNLFGPSRNNPDRQRSAALTNSQSVSGPATAPQNLVAARSAS